MIFIKQAKAFLLGLIGWNWLRSIIWFEIITPLQLNTLSLVNQDKPKQNPD